MTAHSPGGEVRSLVLGDIDEEAGALTSEISGIIEGGVDPSSIAVLVRSGYRAQKVLDRLVGAGLPVTSWLTAGGDTTARRILRASLSVVRPRLGVVRSRALARRRLVSVAVRVLGVVGLLRREGILRERSLNDALHLELSAHGIR